MKYSHFNLNIAKITDSNHNLKAIFHVCMFTSHEYSASVLSINFTCFPSMGPIIVFSSMSEAANTPMCLEDNVDTSRNTSDGMLSEIPEMISLNYIVITYNKKMCVNKIRQKKSI